MFKRLQERVPATIERFVPALSLGGAFTVFMILLYVVTAITPAVLVEFESYSMAAALQTTVIVVGGAYLLGLAVVFRYF